MPLSRIALFTCPAILLALWAHVMVGQPSGTTESGLRGTALRVIELETKRQEVTGNVATIDSLLSFYSDNVVYEHPGAGAVVRGKAALRDGMLHYIGSIRHVRSDSPQLMEANGVVVAGTSAHMDILDGTKWIPVWRRGLRVIEFDSQGLVRRIIDYPW